MATDPRAQLGDRYEIVGELRHDEHSTTWLGRHRTLGRDVSITVLRAADQAERNILGLVAADSRILGTVRHDHVVPVLDTQWLSTDELAVVRPRVRGTTLRSVVGAAGTLSPKRTEELLREIGTSLEWAKRNGIVHRWVGPDNVCVQQGSKKVLVSFGPPAILDEEKAGAGAPAPVTSGRMMRHCSDSNTLAMLGFTMLTGHEPTGGEGSLQLLRPDVPAPMADALDEGLRCDGQAGMLPLSSFLARLGAKDTPARTTSHVTPAVAGAAVPVAAATGATAATTPAYSRPVVTEPVSRGGSGLRVAMTLLVLVALALGAWVFLGKRDSRPVAEKGKRDTTSTAGDVAIDMKPAGTGILTDGTDGRVQRRTTPAPAPAPAPAATPPVVTPVPAPVPAPSAAPAPIATPAPATTPPPIASSGDGCASPAPADQRRCLNTRLAESDRGLNATYASLMRALGARDPGAAAALRDRQRAWIDERDRACRGAGSGTFWAAERAQCLAAQSAARERELAAQLDRT